MVYLVCPECGMVGYRIRPNSLVLHPIYKKLHQEYVCQNCGTTLRRCGYKEYHKHVVAGAKSGA